MAFGVFVNSSALLFFHSISIEVCTTLFPESSFYLFETDGHTFSISLQDNLLPALPSFPHKLFILNFYQSLYVSYKEQEMA